METPSLPPIATLTSATTSPETKTSTLDTLFEPSQTLHGLVIPLLSASYPSYSVLVAAIRTLLLALAQKGDADHDSDEEKKLVEILGAHPRLGAKKVDSVLSRMEQERAGLNTDQGASAAQEEEARLLAQLNKEYEEKFPGLRYVVFVNARPRSVIMENMRKRIARGDYSAEKKEAVNAMCDIALDRAGKLGAEI